MSKEPEGFREFVVARSPALLRTAWMLTGDAALAEDLLQTALAKTWPHWSRVSAGQPEAYVRTVMVRTNASWRRRLWRNEKPAETLPDFSGGREARTPSAEEQTADRVLLAEALAQLPVRQRQAVVLRYFDDLSVATVAQIMGTSPGTVKSQCAKGTDTLRSLIGGIVRQEETL